MHASTCTLRIKIIFQHNKPYIGTYSDLKHTGNVLKTFLLPVRVRPYSMRPRQYNQIVPHLHNMMMEAFLTRILYSGSVKFHVNKSAVMQLGKYKRTLPIYF